MSLLTKITLISTDHLPIEKKAERLGSLFNPSVHNGKCNYQPISSLAAHCSSPFLHKTIFFFAQMLGWWIQLYLKNFDVSFSPYIFYISHPNINFGLVKNIKKYSKTRRVLKKISKACYNFLAISAGYFTTIINK